VMSLSEYIKCEGCLPSPVRILNFQINLYQKEKLNAS
jgi:hypothetical protein